MNDTFNFTIPQPTRVTEYVVQEQHVFSMSEIVIVISLFIALSYFYVIITKDKDKYEKWINPNGHEINLYTIVRRVFWAYVAMVVVFGVYAILMAPR